MKKAIYTCLWYNNQAKEAVEFYTSILPDSKILSESGLTISFELGGKKFLALNGGPNFKFTPAVSLFVTCETGYEVEKYWSKLSDGGKVLMPYGSYPWSSSYGWCEDKYGLSWQIYQGDLKEVKQKIVPCLLFVGKQYGRAEEGVRFYTSVFGNSTIGGILLYDESNPEGRGKVMHSQFSLGQSVFMAMDGSGEHEYSFNPAASFVVECETQQEIDRFWEILGSEGEYNQCGWLSDKFGVSWQIIPEILSSLMLSEKAPKVVEAFMKMQKFDIQKLLEV